MLPCSEDSDVSERYRDLQLAVPSHRRQLQTAVSTVDGLVRDVPGLYSVQPVPSHRRELQTVVSTSAGLTSALANTAVGHIVLAPGTYYLSAELSITRSIVLEAAVAGSCVLHAQASSSNPRRVLNINPGSTAVVQLIGLNITGGNVNVRAHMFKISHRPHGTPC